MMKQQFYIGFLLLFYCNQNLAQSIQLLSTDSKASFRGLSVVDDRTVWVSGSNGAVGKSTNGGRTWRFQTVPGFEKTDFRDIEAFDSNHAIIMGIDCPAVILNTDDGGQNWKIVFQDTTKGMFLDAMEFNDSNYGVVIGDPINGRAFVAKKYKEKEWIPNSYDRRPVLDSGEAFFASSGSNIKFISRIDAVAVTGGLQSNLLINQKKIRLPMLQGKESTGANSIAVKDSTTFMIVGGDFSDKDDSTGNYCFTRDRGQTWIPGLTPPSGYRSCVEYLNKNTWITCGLNGVDLTEDDGLHFRNISKEGFHVCRKAKKGNSVFLAGSRGRIAIFNPALMTTF